MIIDSLVAGHYRIPLPIALSDSTHGTITHFELITVRVADRDGAEGLGYSYTVGVGGTAIWSLIEREHRREPRAGLPGDQDEGGPTESRRRRRAGPRYAAASRT
jgi:hypothetical protein